MTARGEKEFGDEPCSQSRPTFQFWCFADLDAWTGKASLVKATPWRDLGFAGDGTFIEDLLPKARGIVHIPRCLFVHN